MVLSLSKEKERKSDEEELSKTLSEDDVLLFQCC
jgi:hypothetical protein